MKKITFLVLGAGDRGNIYASFSTSKNSGMTITGVAEPDKAKREAFANKYKIKKECIFKNYEHALSKEKFADAVIIATPDNMHYSPAVEALKKGYHLLIEKPVSDNITECNKIRQLNKKQKKIIAVCHVLRYTPFFIKIKNILVKELIGDIVTIEHMEPVGYWHQAHSYVRGNWRNLKKSSPMILAKCCHDFDLLLWLTGKRCIRISSFGSLLHFRKQNAPEGSTLRCTDGCKVEKECPYSAKKIYLNMKTEGWPVSIITKDLSYKGRLKALEEGPYGKCVYRCDNNVVDHQTVAMEFDGGMTASLTMSGFTHNVSSRRIRIMGTEGEIIGDTKTVRLYNFINGKRKIWDLTNNENALSSGHFGGDSGVVKNFIKGIRENNYMGFDRVYDTVIKSHMLALKAEESRLKKKSISVG